MTTLAVGDFAPGFLAASIDHPLDVVGGYRAILCFFGSSSDPRILRVLQDFKAVQPLLAQREISFFGFGIDPDDRLLDAWNLPDGSFRLLLDRAGISDRYGVCQVEQGSLSYEPTTFVLDENLRVLGVFAIDNPLTHVKQVLELVRQLPAPEPPKPAAKHAPVLVIPDVFKPAFCQHLIELYEADGGKDSGFMQQIGDKTAEVANEKVKKRRDLLLTDPQLLSHINAIVWRRVRPEIEKAFQFRITQFERYLVACYDSTVQGFFKPHRDNVTAGTAHRRFAMTLNLNAGYEGGDLRFPEYGSTLYRPDVGEAVIFSCSLLHEATPVTRDRRFTLLSFFYDDADQQLRQANQKHVVLGSTAPASPAP